MERANKPIIFDPAASAELDSIYKYTAETWGEDQASRYLTGLQVKLNDLSMGGFLSRTFSTNADNVVNFIRYEKHYVFFQERIGAFYVLALMHERVDISGRLNELLGD